MRFLTEAISRALIVILGLAVHSSALGQQVEETPLSPTEKVIQQSSEQDRYTFVIFYRTNDNASQAMAAAIQKGISARQNGITLTYVQVTDPAEKKLIEHLGISRAPMPLCVAMAPNGAVTGAFGKIPSDEQFTKAFVTPTMSHCMKALQEGKVVLLCVQGAEEILASPAVASFQADPQFKDRVATVTLDTTDPAEIDFLKQLEIDSLNAKQIATVMLAPPGVLVGKYTAETSFEQMAAALHAAGKCCDDPNCKHHKQATGSTDPATSQAPSTTQRK